MKKKTMAALVLSALALFIIGGMAYVFYSSSTSPAPESPKKEKNILVLGLDARDGGTGRTDTIMVVNVNPESGQINLLSIPRDTRVTLKGGYDRINAAYVYGGIDMVEEAVEKLLDIHIDNYVIIHFQGFIELVDLLGGVEADVPVRMYHPSENIDLQPGHQVLNGEDALGFARYRYTENGDLDRAQHQQEILEALRKKVFSPGTITKIPELAVIASEYIDTNMTDTDLMTLTGSAEKFKEQELKSSTLPGETVKIDGLWYYDADVEQLEAVSLPFKKAAEE